MATYTKYQDFVLELAKGNHKFHAAGDTYNAVIHSDAPTVATDTVLGDLTQITGTGYTAGGSDVQNDCSATTGTLTATAVDITWTATAADWVAGRYVSVYDTTPASKWLVSSWDYGANFTTGNGETFTLDFGASWFTIA
jgi:hypothetical protein